MKSSLLQVCGCCVLAAACVGSAKADTFNVTFSGEICTSASSCSGGAMSGSLTLTAAPYGGVPGEELVSAVGGTADGSMVTGIIGVNGYEGNDNLLFVTGDGGSYFDGNGLSFSLANGLDFEIYGPPLYSFIYGPANSPTGGQVNTLSLAPAAVAVSPEPESLVLLGTGALGMVGMIRRRIRRS